MVPVTGSERLNVKIFIVTQRTISGGIVLIKKRDNSGDNSGDSGLDEWKVARDMLDKFDDRINDLRKFGFTFLSGLIAADALTKLWAAPDDRIRLSVVIITLLLTVALMVLDKNYILFQDAAAIRAKILEVRLNLELTETISFRSRIDRFRYYVLSVYLAFAFVGGGIGILLFYTKVDYFVATIVSIAVAVLLICLINRIHPNSERQVDWSFDQTTCEKGEAIRIMATNLCPKEAVSFPKGKPVWVIRKEGETEDIHSEANHRGLVIEGGNNFSWEVSTDKLEPGIYRVFPAYVGTGELWSEPLKRAIIVSPHKSLEKLSG